MVLASLSSSPQPSIAVRQGISWGLDKPTEDSSVLVLSTPGREYIDIRFPLTGDPTAAPFWAFGGTVNYTPLLPPSTSTADNALSGWSNVIRGEWSHPIDSNGLFGDIDRADVITMANGDQVEVGVLDDGSGEVKQFKEFWTNAADVDRDTYPCVFATYTEGEIVKGMVIRVGRWVQGIVQLEDTKVEVLRWHLEDGKWEEDSRSGKDARRVLPVEWMLEAGRREGDVTVLSERSWVVKQVHLE